MKIEQLYNHFISCKGITTDTRRITKDSLFFALKGENFNGNTFAKQAIENGAKYVVIDEEKYTIPEKTILVNNVLKILQELATYHRAQLKVPIIALTGSNGKTTTKELINTVLSKKYNTTATIGNLNNHIGVPLTLLSMTKDTQIGIVEMGANHLKEIDFLCNIANPDFGYITNFGKAHLEGFGSTEGVIKAKSELYNYLLKNNKYVFLNADDAIQKEKLIHYIKKIGFSKTDTNYFNIQFIEANPFVKLKTEDTIITSQLIGKYNFTNICAATIIGKYFNIELKAIKEAIENYKPTNNRSQILNKNSNRIILDAYNANPTSMKAALQNLSNLQDNNKVAFLGDMFELGSETEKEHQSIIEYAITLNISKIFLIGDHFLTTKSDFKKVIRFKSFEDIKTNIETLKIKNATLLIKGSRGMALERLLDIL